MGDAEAAGREELERLMDQVRADPMALGAVLTGSHAAGLATEQSDYDVRVILRDEATETDRQRYEDGQFSHVDLRVMPLGEFAAYAAWDSPSSWDRYSFAHARVLFDPTGAIAPLVQDKGQIAEEQRAAFTRGALDAFINSVYRSRKCHRQGNALCARIEAVEAVQHALAVIFALEGRLRPYPAYLRHELRQFPLQTFPASGEQGLAWIAAIVERGDPEALRQLFRIVLVRAREAGDGDVIDSWGDDVTWMLADVTK